jgi:hypothetical protein
MATDLSYCSVRLLGADRMENSFPHIVVTFLFGVFNVVALKQQFFCCCLYPLP